MRLNHVLVVSVLLCAAGLSLFLYKLLVLQVPLQPGQAIEAWTVEMRTSFRAQSGKPVKLELALPAAPEGFSVVDETFVAGGYSIKVEPRDGNRVSTWAVRRATGEQMLYYQTVVTPREVDLPEGGDKPPFPKPPELGEPLDGVVDSLVRGVREHSADIATFASETISQLNGSERGSGVELLLGGEPTPERVAEGAVIVLAGARIPARVVYGLQLGERNGDAPLQPLLEVHDGSRWVLFDPTTAARGQPDRFLIWSHGTKPLVDASGVRGLSTRFAFSESLQSALELAEQRADVQGSRALKFSLLGLPVQLQNLYRVLLLVPIGALVVVGLRTLVGLKTFGTFAPVLMALAFRETQLLNGILLFSVIVLLGLGARFYLERLQLLSVPRLAAVLTMVVLMLAAISVIAYQLELTVGLSVALFPVVILAMTIERMSVVWEESGPGEASQQALGSLFAASLGYLVMSRTAVEHLVFVFPELLLLLLAVMLLLGRYTGYRLTELTRFRALAR